ncbi:MAG: hypothetical protein PVH88_13330 [Ignavibacteria bacterium]|jgi:exopolyphosphatase/guanosine-5'-triphosphate,3'-diphosphate pyrophosphatase
MNIASIDIGSNTVLLLIAEYNETTKEMKTILNSYKMPRISKGLKVTGFISDEKITELLKVLEEYNNVIKENNCETVILKATNAMRIAENSSTIVKTVKEKFNFDIDVVPGEEEARLSFIGASSAVEDKGNKIVIDIGGGSTEIIYGNNKEIIYRKSFEHGAVSLTEKFVNGYPVNNEAVNKINDELDELFADLKRENFHTDICIAVAGTPTTLSCMNLGEKEYSDEKIEGSHLSSDNLSGLIKTLKTLVPSEILEKFGQVVTGREDVILSGALILSKLTAIMNLEEIIVSAKGIRYGAVIDYVGQFKRT